MSKPKGQKTQTIDQFFSRQTASDDNDCEAARDRNCSLNINSNFRSTEMEHQNTAASLSQTQENQALSTTLVYFVTGFCLMQRKLPF
jgi:hypothetical protein